MATYNYKGYEPYGCGEMFIIDGFASDKFTFKGNATEECIKNGAEFKIIDELSAVLFVGTNKMPTLFIKSDKYQISSLEERKKSFDVYEKISKEYYYSLANRGEKK